MLFDHQGSDGMRTRIVTSLAGISILLIAGIASADQFEDGVAAYRAQDYETAITRFTVLASTGHAEAQLFLAEMYSSGQGVDADFEAGHELMLTSAKNGSAEAAYRLGGSHDRFFSDDDEVKKALPWYELSTENGHKKAPARLAELHHPETGRFSDTEKYLHWLHKAAEAKHAASMFELARIYNAGKLVPADTKEAVRLVQGSAQNGHGDAQYYLSQMYMKGQGVDADPDVASKWLINSAVNRSPAGLHLLGVLYVKGEGGATQDIEQGLALLQESAALDYTAAHMALSEIYGQGFGVEKDLQTAMSWVLVAKEKGLPNADETVEYIISTYEISPTVQHYGRIQAERCLKTDYEWCGSYYPY